MSHTVHPFAHRIGILRDWKSRWFLNRSNTVKFRHLLREDTLLREYIEKRLRGFYIDSIDIERGESKLRIIIRTSRPGMIIGRSGEGSNKLRSDIEKKMRKIGARVPANLKIDIEEIRSPESRAAIVASMVIEALEKKVAFRRVLKQTMEKVMANKDVKGVRITLSGRLGGAEMGRTESMKRGRLPLRTLRADIDYCQQPAFLSPEGAVGVKVWIYRGDIFEDKKTKGKE